ncbi:MAG: hypothetical protein AAGD10_09915 [Myxococcota bacterium]
MDPVWTLFGALLALHLIEGLVWVRREAVVFRGGRVDGMDGGLGNVRGRFVLLPSLPPLLDVFVVEPWPVLGHEDGFELGCIETWKAPRGKPALLPPDTPMRRDGLELQFRGRHLKLGSRPRARQVQSWMKRYAGASAEKSTQSWLKETHDGPALKRRLQNFRRWTARLGWWTALYGLVLFAGTWGFFQSPEFRASWPWWVGLLLALWFTIGIEFFVAHRRLHPEDRAHRWTLMALLLLSPPAPIRARQWLALDSLALHHPLPVGVALIRDAKARSEFVEWVGRRLRHPLGEDGPASAVARQSIWKAHQSSARTLADPLDLEALVSAPPADADSARSYCPRCKALYDRDGECPDCPGIRLVSPSG